jgi:DNA-directed RNA polymerase subunit M/transcription elongation factor TFIIS
MTSFLFDTYSFLIFLILFYRKNKIPTIDKKQRDENYQKYNNFFNPDYRDELKKQHLRELTKFVQENAIVSLGEAEKCKYCGQNSVLTYTIQTRSLDEGGTNKKKCLSCNREN